MVNLSKGELSIFFAVKTLQFEDTKIEFEEEVDVLVDSTKKELKVQLLDRAEGQVRITKNE